MPDMADQYSHADGSRECRPSEPENASLFTEAEAPAMPPPEPDAKPLSPEQQATLDRLIRNPVVLLEINAMRMEQVTRRGHSDATDSELPLQWLPSKGRDWTGDAIDVLRNATVPAEQRLPMARRKMIKAIALLMAGVDRIDLELAVLAVEKKHHETHP